MQDHHVWIEGTILAPSVATCGPECPEQGATSFDIAGATLVALLRTVPPSVPGAYLPCDGGRAGAGERERERARAHAPLHWLSGIAFVSEDRGEEIATECLDAINKFPSKKPWMLTFCFNRALQVVGRHYHHDLLLPVALFICLQINFVAGFRPSGVARGRRKCRRRPSGVCQTDQV